MACYREALRLKPDYRRGPQQPGATPSQAGQAERRRWPATGRPCGLEPDYPEAHNNLGNALQEQGPVGRGGGQLPAGAAAQPDYAEAHNNLGIVLRNAGPAATRRWPATARPSPSSPTIAEAHNNLGNALASRASSRRRWPASSEALRLKPDYAEAHNNLGIALQRAGQAGGGGGLLSAGPAPQARLCRGALEPGAGLAAAWATSSRAGPSTNGGGSARSLLRCRLRPSRAGTARPWTAGPSCCTPSRGWATRCNSSATPRWSSSAAAG